ncbi:winged helix-turn-helix domain-containing protein [Citrobacter sp. wls620]|uniref:winged helix-turn-helix domain-containing protein n=1 Tax=Citrobacter sp. wls620 TaxID=2576431 RepID=UPI0020787638|nr:winged helix-turn-helix domain-containing protein [Citrobacter sp. wls620]
MFFICNNSLLFDPEAHAISLVGQPESVLTLSAPAVRLLQEFIKHRGRDLSREELIARVWEEFGFTPSGNNLNKAVSELRKSFQSLGEGHELIVTVPRYGFRFDADVIFQPGEKIQAVDPHPPLSATRRSAPASIPEKVVQNRGIDCRAVGSDLLR